MKQCFTDLAYTLCIVIQLILLLLFLYFLHHHPYLILHFQMFLHLLTLGACLRVTVVVHFHDIYCVDFVESLCSKLWQHLVNTSAFFTS